MEQNMFATEAPQLPSEQPHVPFEGVRHQQIPQGDLRDKAYEERLARRKKIAEQIEKLQAPDRERLERNRQTEKNRRNAVQASRKKNRRNKR